MSFFSWFANKTPVSSAKEVDSSGPETVDASVPFAPSGRERRSTHTAPGGVVNRRSERLERRELLYTVVRESMTKVGILSANYKFKVLSLDSKGRQYLVMMDLARLYATETGRLAEIENLIAQSAKSRHDILVTAVYWRVNEHVTTGLSHLPTQPTQPTDAVPIAASESPKSKYEPLLADEMAAFKQALASPTASKSLSSPGEIIHSGRRNSTQMPQFADTELDERQAPLSGTQYGDLV